LADSASVDDPSSLEVKEVAGDGASSSALLFVSELRRLLASDSVCDRCDICRCRQSCEYESQEEEQQHSTAE